MPSMLNLAHWRFGITCGIDSILDTKMLFCHSFKHINQVLTFQLRFRRRTTRYAGDDFTRVDNGLPREQ
jgi:hypothetical protein